MKFTTKMTIAQESFSKWFEAASSFSRGLLLAFTVHIKRKRSLFCVHDDYFRFLYDKSAVSWPTPLPENVATTGRNHGVDLESSRTTPCTILGWLPNGFNKRIPRKRNFRSPIARSHKTPEADTVHLPKANTSSECWLLSRTNPLSANSNASSLPGTVVLERNVAGFRFQCILSVQRSVLILWGSAWWIDCFVCWFISLEKLILFRGAFFNVLSVSSSSRSFVAGGGSSLHKTWMALVVLWTLFAETIVDNSTIA